eukprot:TRINITY_DN14463_c0_g1_i2.p1 TRINITY_DN14463_c0_g1~~TRINITY_DN14463_c0_g1_i2.p1  ORF type:complete len:409 (-),score=60.77 TRINITY_DN14463_c0_g1_i2:11-1180(-)
MCIRDSLLMILTGYVIFLCGIYTKNLAVILAARVIQGLGAESVFMCNKAVMVKWFLGNRFTFALALNHSISRGAVMLSTATSPRAFSQSHSVFTTLALGFFGILIMLAISFFVKYIDYKTYGRHLKTIRNFTAQEISTNDKSTYTESIIQNIKSFGLPFYLAAVCISLNLSIFYSFATIANAFLQVRYGISAIEASNYWQISILVCLPGPVAGYIADVQGHRTTIVLLGFISATTAFLLLAFDVSTTPGLFLILALCLFGAFDLLCAPTIWAMIPHTVQRNQVGLAMGVASVMLNLALFILPLVIGLEHLLTNGNEFYAFTLNAWTFAICCTMGIITILLLKLTPLATSIDKPDERRNQPCRTIHYYYYFSFICIISHYHCVLLLFHHE